jgi:hypothetical protein
MPLPAPRLRQAGRCKLSFAKSRHSGGARNPEEGGVLGCTLQRLALLDRPLIGLAGLQSFEGNCLNRFLLKIHLLI